MTLTELEKIVVTEKQISCTVDSLSRKLQNETMKYDEAEMFIELLGYKIKFEKV